MGENSTMISSLGLIQLIAAIDEVDERAEHRTPPQSVAAESRACRIGHGQQPIGEMFLDYRRVMKFVAAEAGAGGAERGVAEHPRTTISEMQPPLGKARDERQEVCHPVSASGFIEQNLAEHHIAAAFAIDRLPIRGSASKAGDEGVCGSEPLCPKLGVAARQIDRVGARQRRLIRQRREEYELGALAPPAIEQRRVDKAECFVAGYRYALAKRRDPGNLRTGAERRTARQIEQPNDMAMGADLYSAAVDDLLGICELACGYETEIP